MLLSHGHATVLTAPLRLLAGIDVISDGGFYQIGANPCSRLPPLSATSPMRAFTPWNLISTASMCASFPR